MQKMHTEEIQNIKNTLTAEDKIFQSKAEEYSFLAETKERLQAELVSFNILYHKYFSPLGLLFI